MFEYFYTYYSMQNYFLKSDELIFNLFFHNPKNFIFIISNVSNFDGLKKKYLL